MYLYAFISPVHDQATACSQLKDGEKHCFTPASQILNTDGGSISPTPSEVSQQPFGCGCGKCMFFSFIKSGCPYPIPSASSFPYLNLSRLTHEQQQELKGRLRFESQEIMMEFQHLVSATKKSLVRQDVSSDELWSHVMYVRVFEPVFKTKKLEVPFSTKPKTLDTIEKIFMVLEDYFSFFNYGVINHIINALGTEKDKAELQLYKEKFDHYAKRRIFEIPPAKSTEEVNIFVKLDSLYGDYTDDEIDGFCHKLCEMFDLKTFCHSVK